jgi:hypothetical protein
VSVVHQHAALGRCPAVAVNRVQVAILEFETQWWRRLGDKDTAIRDQFGMEPDRYYILLDALLDEPEALWHAPATITRYRDLRERRRQRQAQQAQPAQFRLRRRSPTG